MLNKIKESLLILDEQLQTLWSRYLTGKPVDWLHDHREASGALREMRFVLEQVQRLQTVIDGARDTLNSPAFKNIMEKEN